MDECEVYVKKGHGESTKGGDGFVGQIWLLDFRVESKTDRNVLFNCICT